MPSRTPMSSSTKRLVRKVSEVSEREAEGMVPGVPESLLLLGVLMFFGVFAREEEVVGVVVVVVVAVLMLLLLLDEETGEAEEGTAIVCAKEGGENANAYVVIELASAALVRPVIRGRPRKRFARGAGVALSSSLLFTGWGGVWNDEVGIVVATVVPGVATGGSKLLGLGAAGIAATAPPRPRRMEVHTALLWPRFGAGDSKASETVGVP